MSDPLSYLYNFLSNVQVTVTLFCYCDGFGFTVCIKLAIVPSLTKRLSVKTFNKVVLSQISEMAALPTWLWL